MPFGESQYVAEPKVTLESAEGYFVAIFPAWKTAIPFPPFQLWKSWHVLLKSRCTNFSMKVISPGDALSRLDPEQQDLLWLREAEGQSYAPKNLC
jgi:hypothetical protein